MCVSGMAGRPPVGACGSYGPAGAGGMVRHGRMVLAGLQHPHRRPGRGV